MHAKQSNSEQYIDEVIWLEKVKNVNYVNNHLFSQDISEKHRLYMIKIKFC